MLRGAIMRNVTHFFLKRRMLRLKRLVRGLVLVALLAWAGSAWAGTQDFTLVNDTGVVINAVYCSPSSENNWQEDILGVDTLAAGESVTVKFSGFDRCQWDLRIEDTDGDALEWTGLNLCDISRVTLHWDGSNATADLE